MEANDLEEVFGSRGYAQDHLAAKGCLGFVILFSPEKASRDNALTYGTTAVRRTTKRYLITYF